MDRNFILALVLTGLVFFGYDALILGPQREAYEQAQIEAARIAAEEAKAAEELAAASGEDFFTSTEQAAIVPKSREEAMAASAAERLPIDTPELKGSINLRGLVFDDITLKNYRESVDPTSDQIVLFSPSTSPSARYVRAGNELNGRSDRTVTWSAPDGAVLTPETPVTLTAKLGQEGFDYLAKISVDEKFMFAVEYTIVNNTGTVISAAEQAWTKQKAIPSDLENFMILFEGPLAVVGDKPYSRKYKNVLKKGKMIESGQGGWVGITDKYWIGAVIPSQDRPFKMEISGQNSATPVFTASYEMDAIEIADGESLTTTSHIYAGAKVVEILRDYEKPVDQGGLGINRFDMAVDWGNFYIFTRPIFNTLHFFNGLVGNYGVAILLLTLAIKAIMFPLANMSFKSMAGMRKVQPEMVKLRERHKDDQMKLQQEMMALYKKHKINPAAGCLPLLAQMPIFYALYKTLFVTIEMRHEPFLYIKDLAERDPTSLFNLFGLLPFDPTVIPVIGAFLGIGVLPLMMGAGMWVQMKLNPPPTDPMQQKIFAFMPLIFLFIFAPFAAGLVLYWAWNTILSVIQQYVIMRRNGADVDLIGNIKDAIPFLKSKPATANDNSSQ